MAKMLGVADTGPMPVGFTDLSFRCGLDDATRGALGFVIPEGSAGNVARHAGLLGKLARVTLLLSEIDGKLVVTIREKKETT